MEGLRDLPEGHSRLVFTMKDHLRVQIGPDVQVHFYKRTNGSGFRIAVELPRTMRVERLNAAGMSARDQDAETEASG